MYMGDTSAINSGLPVFTDLPAVLPDIGSVAISQGFNNMDGTIFPDGGTYHAMPIDPPKVTAPAVTYPTVAGIELTPKNLLIAALVAYLLLRR